MVTMEILLQDSPAVLARVQMFPQAISILPLPVTRVLGAQMRSAIVFKVKQVCSIVHDVFFLSHIAI